LSPNGLITIAADVAEGNVGGGERCCFDEDAAVLAEAPMDAVPKWEGRGYTPYVF
jgi:hypothetical protein